MTVETVPVPTGDELDQDITPVGTEPNDDGLPVGDPEDNSVATGDNKSEPDGSESTPTDPEVTESNTQAQETANTIADALESHGIDYDNLVNEYIAQGGLTEKTYSDLAAAGYPAEVVNAVIANMEGAQDKFTNAVIGAAGGEQGYDQLESFIVAKGNEAVDAFNSMLESGNIAVVKMAIAGLKAEMAAKHGTATPLVLGGNAGGGTVGFASEKEMFDAMQDERYQNDNAYRKEVERKLIASKIVKFKS